MPTPPMQLDQPVRAVRPEVACGRGRRPQLAGGVRAGGPRHGRGRRPPTRGSRCCGSWAGRPRAYGAGLVVVSHGDCGLGRQLEAAGFAQWLQDGGDAFQQLGLTERKLGRTRRQGGVFVVDSELVLRFAFSSKDSGEWIPASFVISRLAAGAATPVLHRRRSRLQAVETPSRPGPGEPAEEEPVAIEHQSRSQSAVDTEMDELVRQVGERLGLSSEELSRLSTASRFRDLGMAMVPNSIITKDGPLTDEEWDRHQAAPQAVGRDARPGRVARAGARGRAREPRAPGRQRLPRA